MKKEHLYSCLRGARALLRPFVPALLMFLSSSFVLPDPAEADTVILSEKMDNVLIDRRVEWLEDREGKLGVEEVSLSAAFHPAGSKRTLNFGVNNYSYWIRLTVKNPLPRDMEWVYEMKEARTSLASVSWRGPDGAWVTKTAGDIIPREEREMDLRRPTFMMKTPGNSEQVIYVHSRMVQSGASVQTASIFSPAEYERATRFEYLLYGLYYGAMGIMFFYNLFLYYSVRDRSYLYYVAYLFCMALFWINMNGIGYAWLWGPSNYLVLNGGAGMVGASLIWVTLFTQTFLRTKELLPRFHRVLNLLYVLAGAILILYLFRISSILVPLAYFGAVSTLFYLIGGFLALRERFRAARYYTLSWSMFVLGAIIYSLRDMGIVPFNLFTTWSAQAGNLLEIALLSFALADRINILQKEKMEAQAAAREKDQQLVDALRRAKDELEIKVTERTAELREQKDRAEQATKMKDKFLALVSHDLRSPLASINSAATVLKKHMQPIEAARPVIKLVEGLGKSSASLLNLIDQLLNISRLQLGKMIPVKKCVPLAELVDIKILLIAHAVAEKKISIVNDLPAGMKLIADPVLLGEVVANLLSNAVKFTEEGGRVRVYAPDGTEGAFAIADTGNGIPAEILPHLFSDSVKTSTLGTAGERGTGLGLPYCKEIISAHGGDIRVESEPEKGSAFIVSLPVAKTILLMADDQEAHRQIMKNILVAAGLDVAVVEAENGEEALEMLKNIRPHLLISDIQMEPVSGLELLRTIKGDAALRDIPVIIATSGQFEKEHLQPGELREKTTSMGAAGYIQKPVEKDDFLALVHPYL